MRQNAAVLRIVIGLALFAAAPAVARAAVTRAVQDTAVARAVYWGEPLANLLHSLGTLVQAGFGERDVERIRVGALKVVPYGLGGSPGRATYVQRVRFHHRCIALKIRLVAVEIGFLDVRFQAADPELIAAIQDVIWKAHVASLLPLTSVRLGLGDQIATRLEPPKLVLGVSTETTYGCLGYAIDHRLSQRSDTLDLELFGVAPPTGSCPMMLGPARLERTLDIPPGHYTLVVRYREASGRFALDVTDASTKVTTEMAAFVRADEQLHWRFPPRSFALTCGSESARPICDEIGRWLAHQPGISPFSFPPDGLNPYQPDGGTDPDPERTLFRYTSDEVLMPVRRCFTEVAGRIREAVGVYVTLRTWTGDQITAWSNRSFDQPHIAVPEHVTAGPGCTTGP